MTEVRKSMNGFLYDRDLLNGKVKARTDFISIPKSNNLPGFKNIRKLMSCGRSEMKYYVVLTSIMLQF